MCGDWRLSCQPFLSDYQVVVTETVQKFSKSLIGSSTKGDICSGIEVV